MTTPPPKFKVGDQVRIHSCNTPQVVGFKTTVLAVYHLANEDMYDEAFGDCWQYKLSTDGVVWPTDFRLRESRLEPVAPSFAQLLQQTLGLTP